MPAPVVDDAGADYGVILAELAPITSAIASNETVEALALSDAAKERILGGNAARLLKLA
jgi:predicted TIM-barrel fold metal-dependent hydrolase